MGGWLDGFDRGQTKGRKSPRRVFPSPSVVLCAESAFSPSSSQIIIHSLPSTPRTWTKSISFAPPSFPSFFSATAWVDVLRLQSHHRASPLNPLPELSDHPETPQLPLTGILTVSGLQRKSDRRYNRVCLFLQRHHSISCQVARLTLLVVHWSHSDSSTPLSKFFVSLSSLQ